MNITPKTTSFAFTITVKNGSDLQDVKNIIATFESATLSDLTYSTESIQVRANILTKNKDRALNWLKLIPGIRLEWHTTREEIYTRKEIEFFRSKMSL